MDNRPVPSRHLPQTRRLAGAVGVGLSQSQRVELIHHAQTHSAPRKTPAEIWRRVEAINRSLDKLTYPVHLDDEADEHFPLTLG